MIEHTSESCLLLFGLAQPCAGCADAVQEKQTILESVCKSTETAQLRYLTSFNLQLIMFPFCFLFSNLMYWMILLVHLFTVLYIVHLFTVLYIVHLFTVLYIVHLFTVLYIVQQLSSFETFLDIFGHFWGLIKLKLRKCLIIGINYVICYIMCTVGPIEVWNMKTTFKQLLCIWLFKAQSFTSSLKIHLVSLLIFDYWMFHWTRFPIKVLDFQYFFIYILFYLVWVTTKEWWLIIFCH